MAPRRKSALVRHFARSIASTILRGIGIQSVSTGSLVASYSLCPIGSLWNS